MSTLADLQKVDLGITFDHRPNVKQLPVLLRAIDNTVCAAKCKNGIVSMTEQQWLELKTAYSQYMMGK